MLKIKHRSIACAASTIVLLALLVSLGASAQNVTASDGHYDIVAAGEESQALGVNHWYVEDSGLIQAIADTQTIIAEFALDESGQVMESSIPSYGIEYLVDEYVTLPKDSAAYYEAMMLDLKSTGILPAIAVRASCSFLDGRVFLGCALTKIGCFASDQAIIWAAQHPSGGVECTKNACGCSGRRDWALIGHP